MSAQQNDAYLTVTSSDLPPDDFLKLLSFNFAEAHIWLGDRRVMLTDVAFFAGLRHRLIDALGTDETKKLLMRLGFDSGRKDAELIKKTLPPGASINLKFSPHTFRGVTNLAILNAERDAKGAIVRGEFEWRHSVEAEAHIMTLGRSTAPVCWMQQGYATGHVYGMYRVINVYEEIGCRAMGNSTCTVFGVRLANYVNAEAYLDFYSFLKPYVTKDDLPQNARNGKKTEKSAVVDGHADAPATTTASPPAASDGEPLDSIVGKSPALLLTKQMLKSVAPSNATVLFTGESGVGKELFTRNLHRLSRRADQPFVAVSCAAIPETLIEAELFGVERGAYTGASHSRLGRFERANGGTLFLDEIGSLNMTAQVKLLRVIQEREIERIGGTRLINLDVRLVAANNLPLRELVDRGEFREDLFYRLNVFPIHVPPLRERRDDIPDLMAHYLHRYNKMHERNIKGFTFGATRALLNYHYPGNIRELQNLIERAIILTEGDTIDVSNLFAYGESQLANLWGVDETGRIGARAINSWDGEPVDKWLVQFAQDRGDDFSWPNLEEHLFASLARSVLASVDGNISAAARRLGMKRHQLEYRLGRLPASSSAT